MFQVAVSTKEIDGLAIRLAKGSSDLSEAMTEIAGIMLDAVEENFEQEGRPEKWTPLAEVTVEDRREKGFGPETLYSREPGPWPRPSKQIAMGTRSRCRSISGERQARTRK